MAEKNLFQELKDVLQEFKDFLDEDVSKIQPAVQAVAKLVPDINKLIDKLADLMGSLKTEIQNLDVSAIPGLAEASKFTAQVTGFLDAAAALLQNQAEEIAEVRRVADVVTGLPSIVEVKAEILTLIDAVTAHLNSLKAA